MSRGVNKITLIGHVGRDPEVRSTASGTRVANTSLATPRYNSEEADWHRLNFWGKLADVVEQYVKKGDRLYVEGRVQYGSYEKDGVTIPTVDIHVNELVMLGGTGDRAERAAPKKDTRPLTQPEDDGLPF